VRGTRHARTWQTSVRNQDVNAGARHANYLNGMTSWLLAATLALGRNTGLAILKDAGIPIQPRDPKYKTQPHRR
jgi:hypothetical protein